MNYSRLLAYPIALLALLMFVPPAYAASIHASTQAVQAFAGAQLIVRYTVYPEGNPVYTVKLAMGFPVDRLKLVSFVYGSGWIELSQPGYDEIDNASGSFIKTGGYPKGISSPTLFGTATFQVLQNGSSTIGLQDASLVLDSTNANVLDDSAAAQTLVVAATPAPSTSSGPASTSSSSALFDVTVAPSGTPASTPLWWMLAPFALILALSAALRWWRRYRIRALIRKQMRDSERH